MSQHKLLLFDFDGVIADSFHIAHGVAKKLCVYLTETEYRKRFDGNIFDAQKALLAADHGDRCDHALDWLGTYLPEFKMRARPFAGMPELLKDFSRSYTLIIVSSSHNDLIKEFAEKYDLNSAIKDIYGMEIDTRKDIKFKTIFAKYGIEPKETVFVTDTLGDVNEASGVGLLSIGVTWGFQDRETLARGKPFSIVDSPQELPVSIESYFASTQ